MFHRMKYAGGDLYHALRGKVVETTKQGEGWRQAEQFEATQRAKMGEGGERRDRDANGKILSGAQQRNLKNSEGTVDWRSKFSADERYSHVDFGVAKRRRDESVDIDKIAAAAKAFAAQKTAGSDAGSSLGVGATEAGGGAPDSGSKRKRDGEREQQPPLLQQSPVGVAQLVHGLHCLHSALAEKLQRVAPSEVLVESVACW